MINSKEQIIKYFESGIKETKNFRIGIEHEKFLFNNEDNKRVEVILNPEEVSKAIGRGGHNRRLAGQLTGYEVDVFREGAEEDVELTEFSDEIDSWIIDELAKAGLDTAKSVLEQDAADLVKRTDLEEETINDVLKILKEEFED